VTKDREPGNEADFSLSKTFMEFARIDLQNLEVAALMGDVDPDSPGVLAGGINSRMGIPEKVRARILQKRNEQDFADLLFQILILESIARLDAMIAMHEEQMAAILKEIQAKNEALETLDRQHEVIQGELEYYEEHGLFDLDEDGRLKNKEAEAIITDWEARTGQTIDRNDPGSYGLVLTILKQIDDRRIALREDIDGLSTQYENHKQQRDKALQLKEKLLSVDPGVQEQALQDAHHLIQDFTAVEDFSALQVHEHSDAFNSNLETSQENDLPSRAAFKMNFPDEESSRIKENKLSPQQDIKLMTYST
jgi:hypothetical protein